MANDLFERVLAAVLALASSSPKVFLWNAHGGATNDARFICKELGIDETQLRRVVLALAQDGRLATADGRCFRNPDVYRSISPRLRQERVKKARDEWRARLAQTALGDESPDSSQSASSTSPASQERGIDQLAFLEARIEHAYESVPRLPDLPATSRRESRRRITTSSVTESIHRPDVLGAIDDELRAQQKATVFVVDSAERRGPVWVLTVSPQEQARGSALDENLEGTTAWWSGPPKGSADVLSVIAEESQIALRFVKSQPPKPGERLFLFPPRYLESLRLAWSDDEWADRCEAFFDLIRVPTSTKGLETAPRELAEGLRVRQKQAFTLAEWRAGFLWGPPGTGKTYTLGRLLGSVLQQHPKVRILLLSTTNNATDMALCSVDDALASLGQAGKALRHQCKRAGSHFGASYYTGRSHLLPTLRVDLVEKLAEAEATQPRKGDVEAFHAWKVHCEGLRAAIREHMATTLRSCRLAATTTTAASFVLPVLRQLPPYDLVVFDEASQVSLAHALALAPLGKRVMFAGDPKQLAPIVQATSSRALEWLGQSTFALASEKHQAMVFLDEQSRMAPTISDLVEGVFYKQGLKVAADQFENSEWRNYRSRGGGDLWNPPHIRVITEVEKGTWSRKFGGPIRYSSAERIVAEVRSLVADVGQDSVTVLTPFRAQRALLRGMLHSAGLKHVKVTTVHRAQGSEKHTVLFDVVDGSSPFFDAIAERLVNVAVSRAQARLVLLMSEADMANRVLREVAAFVSARMERPPSMFTGAMSLSWWKGQPDFPECLIGGRLLTPSCVLDVRSLDGGTICGVDEVGVTRRFKMEVLARASLPDSERQPTSSSAVPTVSPKHPWMEQKLAETVSMPDLPVPITRCEPGNAQNVRVVQEKAGRADNSLHYLARAAEIRRKLGLPKPSRRKRD